MGGPGVQEWDNWRVAVTPEQMVADVVASSALDGRRIDPDWVPVLHRIATGELNADDVVRSEVERARMMAR